MARAMCGFPAPPQQAERQRIAASASAAYIRQPRQPCRDILSPHLGHAPSDIPRQLPASPCVECVRTLSFSPSKHKQERRHGRCASTLPLQGSSVAASEHESVCQLSGPVQATANHSNEYSLLQVEPMIHSIADLLPNRLRCSPSTRNEPRQGPTAPHLGICSTDISPERTASLLQSQQLPSQAGAAQHACAGLGRTQALP